MNIRYQSSGVSRQSLTSIRHYLFAIGYSLLSFNSFSQNTFSYIHSIFQANCTVGCHSPGGGPSGNLDLTGTDSAVYSRLVGVTPTNPTAAAKGDKRVDPGYPFRSFLLRKCGNTLDADLALTSGEGASMPNGGTALKNKEVEIIRQWILMGAPYTTGTVTVVDTATINKYYSGKGINGTGSAPAKPTAAGSFQVHLGKIFIPAQSEAEYFIKYDLKLADTVKVNRIDVTMAKQSHHFLLYKFQNGNESLFSEGLRLLNITNGSGSSSGYVSLVSAWQKSRADSLPPNTAYLWEKETVLDLNYHIPNFNADSVLAVDVYINVYTEPKTSSDNIMYSTLLQNYFFNIAADNQPHTITKADYSSSAQNYWNIWVLSTHTHKYGIDFDLYERNAGGSLGSQIYEGFYDYDYTFNQGYYEWKHPAVLEFYKVQGSPYVLNPKNGIIMKAKYQNYGSNSVGFGFTTNDEMMLYYVQYSLGVKLTTGLEEQTKNILNNVTVYPNPGADDMSLSFTLIKESIMIIDLQNILGETISTINKQRYTPGNYAIDLSPYMTALPCGTYIINLVSSEGKTPLRIVKAE